MTDILQTKDNLEITGGPEVRVDVSQKPCYVLQEDHCLLGIYTSVFPPLALQVALIGCLCVDCREL
jgi:hypothetical protein